MPKQTLSDDDVIGLLCSRPEAFNNVIALAREVVFLERNRKNLPQQDEQDLVQEALLAATCAVQNGSVRTGEELSRTVKRAIWRDAQRAYRRRNREVYSDFQIEPKPQWPPRENYEFDEKPPDEPIQLLYKAEKEPEGDARTRIDLMVADDELIRYLKLHPEQMYNLNPRRFEELVAAILKDLGYSVELTQNSADGGVDIFATQKSGVGEVLLVVDCKRYARRRPVGVEIVRSLFGVGERHRASMAILATTSFFTKPAHEFQRALCHRLSLKDYHDLLGWLNNYGGQHLIIPFT